MRNIALFLVGISLLTNAAAAQTPDQLHVGLSGTLASAELQPMDAPLVALQWSVPSPYLPNQAPIARVTIDGGASQDIPATLAGVARDYTPATATDESEALPTYAAVFSAPLSSSFTYQVGIGTSLSEPRTVNMVPGPNETIRIVAGASWGYDGWSRTGERVPGPIPAQERTMTQMLNRTPDLLLFVGEMALSSSNKPWDAFMRSTQPIQSTILTMGVIGTADTPENAHQFRERYVLPHVVPVSVQTPAGSSVGNREELTTELMYYGFSAGPVYAIALDTTALCKSPNAAGPTPAPVPPCDVGQADPAQIQWLHDTLEDVREDYPMPWILVFLNHGPYAYADDGDDVAVQQYLQPLFDAFGVDLVLHSNEDLYQRTYPIRQGVPQRDNDSLIPAGLGPVYVMVGAANGDDAKLLTSTLPSHIVKAGPLHGFVEVVADNLTLTVTALTVDGDVYDAFTLDKRLPNPAEDSTLAPTGRMPTIDLAVFVVTLGALLLLIRRRGGNA